MRYPGQPAVLSENVNTETATQGRRTVKTKLLQLAWEASQGSVNGLKILWKDCNNPGKPRSVFSGQLLPSVEEPDTRLLRLQLTLRILFYPRQTGVLRLVVSRRVVQNLALPEIDAMTRVDGHLEGRVGPKRCRIQHFLELIVAPLEHSLDSEPNSTELPSPMFSPIHDPIASTCDRKRCHARDISSIN